MQRTQGRVHYSRRNLSPQRGRQRPLFYGGPDPITLNRMEGMVNNIRTMREEWANRSAGRVDPRRDINAECGYPESDLSCEEYKDLIDWEPMAEIVNAIYPLESWQSVPTVYQSEVGKRTTPFELAWDSLGRMMCPEPSYHIEENGSRVWPALMCADLMAGIGRYGILLIGLNDGLDLDKPAFGLGTNAERSQVGKREITFLRAFPEYMAEVSEVDDDKKSRRKGLPLIYQIQFSDPTEQRKSGLGDKNFTSQRVHWSRVIHISDRWHTAASSLVYGVPRCRPVLHPILDIQKVRGGSAEMFWKTGLPIWHFGTHPSLGADVDVDTESLKDMYEETWNGLQRAVYTNGMTAEAMASNSVDPSPFIEVHVDAISIKTRTPKRILVGSERGELASGDDKKKWNNRLRSRETMFISPDIVAALADRLVNLKVLPEPGKGYYINWPDVSALSDDEKVKVLLTRTQAYAAYLTAGMDQMVAPFDYMTEFDDMTEDKARAVEEAAEVLQVEKEEEAQAQADALGLEPEIEGFKKPDADPDEEHQRAIELEEVKAKAKAKAKPTANVNPKGCNQHTGPGCGVGGTPSTNLDKQLKERGMATTEVSDAHRQAYDSLTEIAGKQPSHVLVGDKSIKMTVSVDKKDSVTGSKIEQWAEDNYYPLTKAEAVGRQRLSGYTVEVHGMSKDEVRAKLAEKGEIDWRPTHTIPEDFYAMSAALFGPGPTTNENPEGCNQYTGPGCSVGGGKSKHIGKSVGAAEHAQADAVSNRVASALGGITEEDAGGPGQKDKKPFDVRVAKEGGGYHDIEVKSLLKGSKQVISVHDDALLRKVEHQKANPTNTFHTVVSDERATYQGGEHKDSYSGHQLYYRRGSGRYPLSKMHKVKDEAELKQLLNTPDKDLPAAARGKLPPPPPLRKLKEAAAKAAESRKTRDKARKERNKDKLKEQARARAAKAKAAK